jgi:PAS domain S-box-containing protein
LGFSHFVGKREKARFNSESELISEQIEAQLHVYLTVLKGIRALYSGSDLVTPDELANYFNALKVSDLQKNSGFEGVGVIAAVAPNQRKDHIARMRKYYPKYELHSLSSNEVVLPIVHLEALTANPVGALGWDLSHDQVRVEAMNKARDTGQPAITEKTELHRADGLKGRQGFILYLPIFAGIPESIAERRASLRGFVFGAFDPAELWQTLLLHRENSIDLEVYDGSSLSRDSLLFDRDGTMRRNLPKAPLFSRQIQADVLGRPWTFSFYSLPVLESSIEHRLPLFSLLAGAFSSLCLFWVVFIPARGKVVAERLSRELQKSERLIRGANEELAQKIEEQKLAARHLAAEKERLAVTLHSIGDAVVSTDQEGKILMMNPVAEAISGVPLSKACGRPLSEVFRLFHPESREPLGEEKPVPPATLVTQPLAPALLIKQNGRDLYVQKRIAPIRDNDGQVTGSVFVFRDVTEQRQHEEELLRSSKLESVGLLAGGIAHDFNNVLTGIVGNLSLIREDRELPEAVRERLGKLESSAFKARTLTQQLLTFAKGGSPIKQTVSISEVIRDSVEFALRGSNLLPEFSLASNLPSVEIDKGQIGQVIQNIVINSIQAMPDGGTIKIIAQPQLLEEGNRLGLKAGAYVKASFQDFGGGIQPENLGRIFDPYFTTRKKSSGLGLATAYSIMRRHEGAITAESEWRKGCTFHLYIPASEKAAPPETPRTPSNKTNGGRILAMDDEPSIRALLTAILSHFGYSVTTAPDGSEAIREYENALASGNPFGVVIMDLTIPGGMGGKETIRRLREIDPQVKAIVSSGYSNDPVLADYKSFGFAGRVEKPYRIQDLESAVALVLGQPSKS